MYLSQLGEVYILLFAKCFKSTIRYALCWPCEILSSTSERCRNRFKEGKVTQGHSALVFELEFQMLQLQNYVHGNHMDWDVGESQPGEAAR